jgi:hypothetical protein
MSMDADTVEIVATIRDLFEFIPRDLSYLPGYCSKSGTPNYSDWERKVATPAIVEQGFTILHWWSPESDSFGVLIRACRCTKDGETFDLSYG